MQPTAVPPNRGQDLGLSKQYSTVFVEQRMFRCEKRLRLAQIVMSPVFADVSVDV